MKIVKVQIKIHQTVCRVYLVSTTAQHQLHLNFLLRHVDYKRKINSSVFFKTTLKNKLDANTEKLD